MKLTTTERHVLGAIIDITYGRKKFTRIASTALRQKANRVREEEVKGVVHVLTESDVKEAVEGLVKKGEIAVSVEALGVSYALAKPYREYQRVQARRKKKHEFKKETRKEKQIEVRV